MASPVERTSWSGVHSAFWLVPAAALLLALLPLPYGFYTFLRLAVCGAAALLAYREWAAGGTVTVWMVVLGALALLFNPLVPVHLSREAWAPIDVGAALLFVVHWWWVRRRRG